MLRYIPRWQSFLRNWGEKRCHLLARHPTKIKRILDNSCIQPTGFDTMGLQERFAAWLCWDCKLVVNFISNLIYLLYLCIYLFTLFFNPMRPLKSFIQDRSPAFSSILDLKLYSTSFRIGIGIWCRPTPFFSILKHL